MATALDLLADHWSATRNTRHSHTLELKGGKLTIWWSGWTNDERDYVFHDLSDLEIAGNRFRPERLKRAFWRKAEREDGSRMFLPVDQMLIGSTVDPNHIKDVALRMILDLNADEAAGGEGDGAGKAPAIGDSPNAS